MRNVTLLAALLAATLTVPAYAEGGDREPAGGAFMSSYSQNPYRTQGRPGSFYTDSYGAPTVQDLATTGSVHHAPRVHRYRHVR